MIRAERVYRCVGGKEPTAHSIYISRSSLAVIHRVHDMEVEIYVKFFIAGLLN
jgi:hypothetical protein